ncbi:MULTISPECIES: molybdopterin cofactor-binding domain-containing protein [Cupriavidus]
MLGTLGAAGALVVGWSAAPARQRLVPSRPLAAAAGEVALNGWIKIGSDDTVTLVMATTEMGQGTFTGLAMLLADEMDADWGRIRLEQAGMDGIYSNQAALVENLPLFRNEADDALLKRATRHLVGKVIREVPGAWGSGGSSAIIDQWMPLREAGAAARAMLIGAAAELWGVPGAACRAENGAVLHPASGRSARFGELAGRAARQPLPATPRLKAPAQFRLIGRPVRRIDNAAKINGTAAYGIDARPAGLLYASITMCPTVGGRVARVEAAAAQRLPGVRKVVVLAPVAGGLGSTGQTAGGVAVIADTPYHAMRALKQVEVEWEHGGNAALSSRGLAGQLAAALDAHAGKRHLDTGDVDAALASAARTIDAEYSVPFLAHATMEPMNCTVQLKDGTATVWVGLQMPGMARGAIAKALGIDADKVEIRLGFLGGGFGRRVLPDFAVQAACLARETEGAPVQLIWSREQDITHDYYRPAFVSRHRAGFDAGGRLVAWQATSAGSSLGAPAFADASTGGASDMAYRVPNARVSHVTVEPGLPLGIWRSVEHSQNAFFTESFVDECAFAAGQDPVAFRAALLAGDARHLHVLQRAAALSGWSTPLASLDDGTRRARGIALHRAFGTVVAQVAEVSVGPDGRIRVHRVVCVVDCGFAVNPNLIRQQMEGAIVFGLSAALHGAITFENGQVQQSNFHDYAPLRMDECPAIEVEIVASNARPGGVGEPGTPPIAPAVANAVHALTGQRLRSLPLTLRAA